MLDKHAVQVLNEAIQQVLNVDLLPYFNHSLEDALDNLRLVWAQIKGDLNDR